MPTEPRSIKRIATDHPALELTDDSRWEVPAGVSYMLIQTWSVGDQVKVSPDPGGEFTHRITNEDAEGDTVTTFARRIAEWPESLD